MAEQTPEQVAAAAAETARVTESQKAMEAMVQGAVRTSIEALMKEGAEKAEAAKTEEARRAAEAAGSGVLNEAFRPALEPALKAAKDAELRAAHAADSVEFYTNPENQPAFKYRAKIEQIVGEQAKRGNQVSRADAWKYLRGGELYGELSKEAEVGYAAKIEEARKATAAGPSTSVPKFSKPVEELTTEELGTAMKGLVF